MNSSKLHKIVKRIAEFQLRNHYKKHWNSDILKYKTCKESKSSLKIFLEQRKLQNYWKCKPYHYYRYGFFRKDCKLSIEQMKDYVPNFFAYYLYFPRIYKGYMQLGRDKSLTHTYLAGLGIPHPKVILKFSGGIFYSPDNLPVDQQEAIKMFNQCAAKRIFVKPDSGLGGYGIFVFTKTENGFFTKTGQEFNEQFVQNEMKSISFVIQEGLIQHPEMDKIYKGSVNTFRLVTSVTEGKADLLFALFRMGQKGSEIDNASQGGLYCKIDHETGRLSEYAYSNDRQKYYNHADSGVVFSETVIPAWEELKNFTLKIALQLKEISVVGWDIAMSENGPVVVEINEGPGVEIVQDLYGGIREVLKIYNPEKWWNYSKFTTMYEY